MRIIRFEFMRTVFSHTEQIGVLRFAVGFLLFCLSFVGVDRGHEFVSVSPLSSIC